MPQSLPQHLVYTKSLRLDRAVCSTVDGGPRAQPALGFLCLECARRTVEHTRHVSEQPVALAPFPLLSTMQPGDARLGVRVMVRLVR